MIESILSILPFKYTLITLVSMHIVWVYYLALMNLKQARDAGTLSKPAYIMALPVLFVGGLADWLFNMILGTLFYWELPTHWKELFSERNDRHLKDTGWKGKQARFWCHNFLDPFDPSGKHCEPS